MLHKQLIDFGWMGFVSDVNEVMQRRETKFAVYLRWLWGVRRERVGAYRFIDRGWEGGTKWKVKHSEGDGSWNGMENETLDCVCCRVLKN